ncbi:hypothetical protein POPTR_001G174350v4 [Populus trichocarpa]|uniref:Uncharacterized protein n=1 Tax=Populus trichocarpa TaxID=3694 RepID=A0ACC0TK64_POPTR|nr:hypothetical protein POPTR_001G174350v4 [Populus trichocarpa]
MLSLSLVSQREGKVKITDPTSIAREGLFRV